MFETKRRNRKTNIIFDIDWLTKASGMLLHLNNVRVCINATRRRCIAMMMKKKRREERERERERENALSRGIRAFQKKSYHKFTFH
jgi:hypothetical protein